MKIDFEYSKWADQADRKRAFADMTFNAKMHCELQRMSTCRELAKIGQYHERECKHLRDTSIDLVDMLHALRLMKDVIGTSSLIDETYTRPDNIRFARTLSVSGSGTAGGRREAPRRIPQSGIADHRRTHRRQPR